MTRTHGRATQGHVNTWRRGRVDSDGLAFDGPTGIVGPCKIGGAYLAHAGDAMGLRPSTFYTLGFSLISSVWD